MSCPNNRKRLFLIFKVNGPCEYLVINHPRKAGNGFLIIEECQLCEDIRMRFVTEEKLIEAGFKKEEIDKM